jgi:hypothetical protein
MIYQKPFPVLKREQLKSIFLSFFFLAGVLFLIFGLARTDSALYARQEHGFTWLLKYPGNYGNPGVSWILADVNTRFCKDSKLTELIRMKANPAMIRDESIAAYYSKKVEDIQAPLPKGPLRGSDAILIPILYCEGGTVPEEVERAMLSLQGATGYDLTHKYLALLFFKEENCTLRDAATSLDLLIEDAAQKIRLDTTDGFDLFAERISFLLYGGFRELVSESDIERILSRQDPSGGWKADLSDSAPHPHTTAVSVWALTQWGGRCPFR